jgi:hypothetical protein
VSCPASRVVIATRCGSTAKCTSVRDRKMRSWGLRSERYCVIACSMVCPVNGFFNSAVATGIPLTTSARSMESAGRDSEWCNCRTTLSRLAAYRWVCCSLRPLAGLK